MKTIPVGRTHIAIVDDEDYEYLSKFFWRKQENKLSRTLYAKRRRRVDGRVVNELMHKIITGYEQTDHINGDGLDNRRSNLRAATATQNRANIRKYSGSFSSPYKGVSWYKAGEKWSASITKDKKKRHLGYFASEIDAARAYDTAAIQYFGEYALLNFDRSNYEQ